MKMVVMPPDEWPHERLQGERYPPIVVLTPFCPPRAIYQMDMSGNDLIDWFGGLVESIDNLQGHFPHTDPGEFSWRGE